MNATLDDLDQFFETFTEECSRSWTKHYNEMLTYCNEEWEQESLKDLIRLNKIFDV